MRAGRFVERWMPTVVDHEEADCDPDADSSRGRRRSRTRAMVAIGLVVGVAVAVVAALGVLDRPAATEAPPALPPASAGSAPPAGSQPAASTSAAASGQVVVSVVGKVRKPGLVELPSGSRVADAVEAAGGVSKRSVLTSVNLARRVADGEQIAVGVAAAADTGGGGGEGAESAEAKPDLNTATDEQLQELPGIGEVMSQAIIDWREKNGPFTNVEQLQEVDGIGERRLETLRELVTVG